MDIYLRCFHCSIFNEDNNKILNITKTILIQSLCKYLEYEITKYKKEIKYIYWFYQDTLFNFNKKIKVRSSEKRKGFFLLKEQHLDGFFKFVSLKKGDSFNQHDINKFYITFDIIKNFIPEEIKLSNEKFLYSPYFDHCILENHCLEIYT